MEYLKYLFSHGGFIKFNGRSYLPASFKVNSFRDYDIAKDVTVQFITMEAGREYYFGFTGDPNIVSEMIQDLRED